MVLGRFRLWDVTSGEELQSFAMETDYSDVRFYNETNCVVVAGSYGMFAIDLNTEEVVFNEEDIDGLYGKCIDIFDDGKAMVHIGPKKVKLFQIEKTQIVCLCPNQLFYLIKRVSSLRFFVVIKDQKTFLNKIAASNSFISICNEDKSVTPAIANSAYALHCLCDVTCSVSRI